MGSLQFTGIGKRRTLLEDELGESSFFERPLVGEESPSRRAPLANTWTQLVCRGENFNRQQCIPMAAAGAVSRACGLGHSGCRFPSRPAVICGRFFRRWTAAWSNEERLLFFIRFFSLRYTRERGRIGLYSKRRVILDVGGSRSRSELLAEPPTFVCCPKVARLASFGRLHLRLLYITV